MKLHVDREIFKNLDSQFAKEIEGIRKGQTTKLSSEKVLSVIEWILFGNPLRRTTVGPNADYTPGRLIVDT